VSGGDEVRDGVSFTNLDQPLFDGAEATKRDLVDYLDAVGDRIVRELADRPLSVVRVTRGQAPFMQKNAPKHRPFRPAALARRLSARPGVASHGMIERP
jgi:bifunctional non-homologous end joining protein LigD